LIVGRGVTQCVSHGIRQIESLIRNRSGEFYNACTNLLFAFSQKKKTTCQASNKEQLSSIIPGEPMACIRPPITTLHLTSEPPQYITTEYRGLCLMRMQLKGLELAQKAVGIGHHNWARMKSYSCRGLFRQLKPIFCALGILVRAEQ